MATRSAGRLVEVLLVFGRLGLTSFGGPVAHLGYFRSEFVERRGWLDERSYADLVGLCQFLPGPASSQTGFALGLLRAGYWGGLAAWLGFTAPSAILMMLIASGTTSLGGSALGAGLLHGLKLVAVAIVAQAVWGMARTLCPDRSRATIATLATLLVIVEPASFGQITAIFCGAVAGLWFCRADAPHTGAAASVALAVPVSRGAGFVCLLAFAILLFGLPLLRDAAPAVRLFGAFFHSGALVFGGGHVVLPLLRNAVVTPGWVPETLFLSGYGAAQAMPGPLFSFAAYLGMVASPASNPIAGGLLALAGIFLPGFLLLTGLLPFWDALRRRALAQAAMRGINAAVVGILGAALYDPVWTSAVGSPADFAIALTGFVLLVVWRAPPLLVVVGGALAGIVF